MSTDASNGANTGLGSETRFDEVRKDIAEGRTQLVGPKVLDIAASDKDPMNRIKCLSLLKVVGDQPTSKEILRLLMSELPTERNDLIQVAGALRGLDFPSNALTILKSLDKEDAIIRMSVLCLMDLEEYEEAFDTVSEISDPTPFDRVMGAEIRSALGKHQEAIDIAGKLLDEYPDNYQVRKCYVSTLLLGGREKEAQKYARTGLKDKSADSNSIAAYALMVQGNYKAAAGYATRAINIDNGHIMAMETLGICLALKGEYDKARIVAGAINEKSPGDRAAINVLRYCE